MAISDDAGHDKYRSVGSAFVWSPAPRLAAHSTLRPPPGSLFSPAASAWEWLLGTAAVIVLAAVIGVGSGRDGRGMTEAPTNLCRASWHIGWDPADVVRIFKKCCAGDENRCD